MFTILSDIRPLNLRAKFDSIMANELGSQPSPVVYYECTERKQVHGFMCTTMG